MAKEKESKIVLEREYIVPLRREWIKVAYYKRAARAIKALKKFIARHMKVEDRNLNKVKLDKWLNNELWFRGIRKPAAKIKVKCMKYDSGIVKVELAEVPEVLKWKIEKEKKLREVGEKVKAEKKPVEVKEEEKPGEKEEKKVQIEEKKEAVIEAGLKEADRQAREVKHEVVVKKGIKKPLARKALQK